MDKTEFAVGNINTSIVYDAKKNSAWLIIKRGKQEMSMSFKSIERLETFALRLYESSVSMWVKAMKSEGEKQCKNTGGTGEEEST